MQLLWCKMPMLLQFMLVWKAGVVNTTTTAPMESCAVPSAAAHPSRHQESILIFLFQNLLLKLSFFSINACGGGALWGCCCYTNAAPFPVMYIAPLFLCTLSEFIPHLQLLAREWRPQSCSCSSGEACSGHWAEFWSTMKSYAGKILLV